MIVAYKKQNEKAVKPQLNCTNRENYDTDIQTAAGCDFYGASPRPGRKRSTVASENLFSG